MGVFSPADALPLRFARRPAVPAAIAPASACQQTKKSPLGPSFLRLKDRNKKPQEALNLLYLWSRLFSR